MTAVTDVAMARGKRIEFECLEHHWMYGTTMAAIEAELCPRVPLSTLTCGGCGRLSASWREDEVFRVKEARFTDAQFQQALATRRCISCISHTSNMHLYLVKGRKIFWCKECLKFKELHEDVI